MSLADQKIVKHLNTYLNVKFMVCKDLGSKRREILCYLVIVLAKLLSDRKSAFDSLQKREESVDLSSIFM